jgi:hypothetical protein
MPTFRATFGPNREAPADAPDAIISGEMVFRSEDWEAADLAIRTVTGYLAPGLLRYRVEEVRPGPPEVTGLKARLPRPGRVVSQEEREQWLRPEGTDPEVDGFLDAVRAGYADLDSPDLQSGMAIEAEPQCEASSWRGGTKQTYGPGGYNRCIHPASHQTDLEGTPHRDDFGNVFVLEPKFKILPR